MLFNSVELNPAMAIGDGMFSTVSAEAEMRRSEESAFGCQSWPLRAFLVGYTASDCKTHSLH